MRYRYTGTGNSGTFAWAMQRISGLVIAVWGTIIFFQLAFKEGHDQANPLLLFPVLAFGMWHTFSGFKMITDDYVKCRALRVSLLFFYWAAGVIIFGLGLSFAL